jgi:hypothetical protein
LSLAGSLALLFNVFVSAAFALCLCGATKSAVNLPSEGQHNNIRISD